MTVINLSFLIRKGITLPFFAISILFYFISCTSSEVQSDDKRPLKELVDEFVQLKYEGGFRTDTVFENTLQMHLDQSSTTSASAKEILELIIEWNLLKGNQTGLKGKLNQLKAIGSPAEDETFIWLQAYHDSYEDRMDAAKQSLHSALEKTSLTNPLQLKTHWLLGSIYEGEEQDSLAMLHYTNAIEVGPIEHEIDYYLESVFHLGNVLYMNEDLIESEKLYRRALEESMNFKVHRLIPFGHYHIGKVEERNENRSEALSQYNQALFYLQEINQSEHFIIPLLEKKIADLEGKEPPE